jgi:hypothetical protein
MTAPVASGWSGCRVGLAPTGKRRLSTAHATSRHRGPLLHAREIGLMFNCELPVGRAEVGSGRPTAGGLFVKSIHRRASALARVFAHIILGETS